MFGFEKKERTNISLKELAALQLLADDLLSLEDEQICRAIIDGALLEVADEKTK